MIYETPRMTQQEYDDFKKQFYYKPGAPEIEVRLQGYQERLVIHGDLSVLPEFRKDLSVYGKSILLKLMKGGHEFIEEYDVEAMAEEAADNFLKRYFRNESPCVGASFAGILLFKIREVRARYFKTNTLESNMSLDNIWGNADDEKTLSNESRLSYKDYLEKEDDEKSQDLELYWAHIESKLDKECALLDKLQTMYPIYNQYNFKLSTLFLRYVLYISILKKDKDNKKLLQVATTALNLLVEGLVDKNKLAPVLESALLDVQFL